MAYHIDQSVFDKTFKSGKDKKFSHKTNIEYNMFPFTVSMSTSDKVLDSFDNILGAFIRTIYELDVPKEINSEAIIADILKDVDCSANSSTALKSIIKDLYFIDENTLRCTGINTYQYIAGTKNDQKISEYIVRTICDVPLIKNALDTINTSKNVLDSLIEKHLPKLVSKKNNVNYISLIPQIKEYFTKDIVFIIKDKSMDFNNMIQLISYYYFFYTCQVILNLNKFCSSPMDIVPVYFCTEWEHTSRSRDCYSKGWKQIENYLKTMLPHAVLLEMLNQTPESCQKKYTYYNLLEEYKNSSEQERQRIFSEIKNMKYLYNTAYTDPDDFKYSPDNYKTKDLTVLIKNFYNDISLWLEEEHSSRQIRKYKESFHEFCKKNFLRQRGSNGYMLILTEEMLVLLTKIVIGTEKQLRLNKLFEEFNKRGIYMDKQTQENVVGFYEKLNLIEKKSDSGDAQYVKGIL